MSVIKIPFPGSVYSLSNWQCNRRQKLFRVKLSKIWTENFFIYIRIKSAVTLLWNNKSWNVRICFRDKNNFLKHSANYQVCTGLKLKMSIVCIYGNQKSAVLLGKYLCTDVCIYSFIPDIYQIWTFSLLKFFREESFNLLKILFFDLYVLKCQYCKRFSFKNPNWRIQLGFWFWFFQKNYLTNLTLAAFKPFASSNNSNSTSAPSFRVL